MDDCDEILNEFQLKEAKRAISELFAHFHFFHVFNFVSLFSNIFISDVRKPDQRIEYLIEQKDDMPAAIIPAAEAIDKWPTMILNYLERMVQFVPALNPDPNCATEINDVDGDPIKITCKSSINLLLTCPCSKLNELCLKIGS